MAKGVDWVVAGGKPGEVGYCTRCGEGLVLGTQPVDIFLAASKAFVKLHSKCKPGKYFEKPAKTPDEWAHGRDSGTSSLTIYSAITGHPSPHGCFDVPHDPDDFGRCYRLLKLFPAWREKLAETINICKEWEPFVAAWDELTELYEEEMRNDVAPKLYKRLQALRK